jgi:tRNA nucleotidyltransferase/poly(A) polymerase
MTLSQKILKDPINRWVFQTCDREIYLAGGFVRDMLLGRVSKDRDYAVKTVVEEISRKTSRKLKGTFIPLKKGQTYRVVVKKKGRGAGKYKAVLDFNNLKSSIYNDLSARDFTINAMAWSPKTSIIDPFEGRIDLKKRTVKAVGKENLIDDPLRMLRAYRFAAEYGFEIEKKTRKYIKNHAGKLASVAQERITEEFFKLLNAETLYSYLRECIQDGVMEAVLFSRMPVDTKNLRRLRTNIKKSYEIDELFTDICRKKNRSKNYRRMERLLDEEISMGLTRKGLIRLFLLLKDSSGENGKLRMSSMLVKALNDMNRGCRKMEEEGLPAGNRIMKKKLLHVFHNSGNRAFETALLIVLFGKKKLQSVLLVYDEFRRLKNRTLINGSEVKSLLKIQQGSKIGKILSRIKEKQLDGIIKTKAEARQWILHNYT